MKVTANREHARPCLLSPEHGKEHSKSSAFAGSAAKCIQDRAEKQGLNKIAKQESAVVRTMRQGMSITGERST